MKPTTRKTNTMLIKAERTIDGKYILVAENEDHPLENYEHDTEKDAYAAAAKIFPANSIWRGRRVPGGFRIDL